MKMIVFISNLSVFLFLCGCGFRTMEVRQPYFQRCHLQFNEKYNDFSVLLKKRLIQTKVIISVDAPLSITINTYFYANGLNVESSVLARLLDLSYQAKVILNYSGRTKELPLFKVERSLYLQPNELLESSEQIKLAREEMAEQLVDQVWQSIIVPW